MRPLRAPGGRALVLLLSAAVTGGQSCRGTLDVDEIRVWDRDGDFLHLAELEVFSPKGEPLALGGTVRVSSTTSTWGRPAQVLVDGDTDQTQYWHSEGASRKEFASVRFPRQAPCVTSVRIWGRSDHDERAGARQGGLVVELRRGDQVVNSTTMDLNKHPHWGVWGDAVPEGPRSATVPHFDPERLHIVFSTECNAYFDWQSAGVFYSVKQVYRAAGLEPPRTTRLTACDAEDPGLAAMHEQWDGHHPNFDTYVHPRFTKNKCPEGLRPGECNPQDVYTAYNKPGSVAHWLQHSRPEADYVAFLDADQVLRNPINPEWLGARKGKVVSALYAYLKGVRPEIHMGVKARMIADGRNHAPFEQAGGFFIFHIEDLRRVAPLWLLYTQRVRADPDSWANTGDVYNCRGAPAGCQGKDCHCPSPPWISEMYGYVFGASEANLSHVIDNRVMLYPAYDADHLKDPFPLVVHYGITTVMDLGTGEGYWAFDKHWYQQRSRDAGMLACPGKPRNALKEPPPPERVMAADSIMSPRSRSIVIYCLWALVNATRAWVAHHCGPGSQRDATIPWTHQRRWQCKAGAANVMSCVEAPPNAPLGGGYGYKGDPAVAGPGNAGGGCVDADQRGHCCRWAAAGECRSNAGYMLSNCRRSCGACALASECGEGPAGQHQGADAGAAGAGSAGRTASTGSAVSARGLPAGAGGEGAKHLPAVAVSGWIVALLVLLHTAPRRGQRTT